MTTDNMQMRSAAMGDPVAIGMRRGAIADAGRWATHYALVVIFLWFGALKFTDFETSGIAPLIVNSPVVGWTTGVFGVAGAAYFIGAFELLTGILLALRPVKPRLATFGAAMAIVTFVVTLSFMFSTPGVVQAGYDSPLALSAMPGQFLLKDLVLLCVSIWALGASLVEADLKR